MKKLLILTACMAMCGIAQAGLKDATKVFTAGNWTVLRDVDKMTDKVSCTGIYKNDFGKQLAQDGLYISIRGGISSVTLRFDDSPARGMRLPTQIEKDVRAVMLEGSEFDAAIASSRLRGQVLTLVSGLQEFDLDLTGIAEASANIKSGCPLPIAAPEATGAPALPPTENPVVPALCSQELLDRLQAAKVTKSQIQKICN